MSKKICITVYMDSTLYRAAEEFCRIENVNPVEKPWTIDEAIKTAASMQLQDWNKKSAAK
jgi:hypothetical protein